MGEVRIHRNTQDSDAVDQDVISPRIVAYAMGIEGGGRSHFHTATSAGVAALNNQTGMSATLANTDGSSFYKFDPDCFECLGASQGRQADHDRECFWHS
jgi:hypothetical protein